ncbi:MAG: hypothetical protein R3F55_06365 [Alphaproteobacteria bacterium]
MDTIPRLALISVSRACGFVGLGIMCVMVGLSFDPYLCAKSGAILFSILALVLRYRAMRAHRMNHRNTEVWVMLDTDDLPRGDYAARLVANAYRDAFLRCGDYVLWIAGALWAIAMALWLWA